MAVESMELETPEVRPGERDSDLFRLAYALGCPPEPITAPGEDGREEPTGLYAIRLSKADPEKKRELGLDGPRTPIEEDPEERANRIEEGLAAIAEYEAEYGAFTADEKAWARGVMARLGIGVGS